METQTYLQVIGVLVLLIVGQQIFFMWQIQKLVDKVMSRSYHEYIKATDPVKPRKVLAEEPKEDFNALTDFGNLMI